MSPATDSTLNDPRRIIADLQRANAELQRKLDERDVEMRAHDERFELITRAVAEGVYHWDVERNELRPSARLVEIFGFQGRNLTASDWNDLVHPEDFERYRNALRDCFRGDTERLDCEYRVRHTDGNYRWIEDRAVPVRDTAGRAVRLAGAVTDISERKAADEALREALEQQIATAEVLGVINSSPGDLAPVFDAMLEKAMRLCDAGFGIMFSIEGNCARVVAARRVPTTLTDFLSKHPLDVRPDTNFGRAILGRAVLHVFDVREGPRYRTGQPLAVAAVDLAGVRTLLMAPLIKDDKPLGVFAIFRQEVRPFTDKQIALLQNFAAQAVIAMENARLLTETREALEQQTATLEVMRMINSSPGYLAPVFDAMLEKASRLCGTAFGVFDSFDGEVFQAIALRGAAPALAEFYREPRRPMPDSFTDQIVQGASIVSADDLAEDAIYQRGRGTRAAVDLGGGHSFVGVALRKEEKLLGAFWMYRREVRPFSEREITLLQNFAGQAVIAMENARLITETREALEQQTATAEVLEVINASPGDLAPVFQAMLERATQLCDATYGQLATYDREFFRFVAKHGTAPFLRQHPTEPLRPSQGVTWQRLVDGETLVHIPDVADTDLFREGHAAARAFVDIGGGRTLLTVALRKHDVLLGALTVYRQEVRPFTDKQVALLQNFAAQAVIAIENARLLTETREALERQTATTEVLQVINASPGNLAPVFDAMLEKALRLCDVAFGSLLRFDGELFHRAATSNFPAALASRDQPLAPFPGSALERLTQGEAFVHIADITADQVFRSGYQGRRALADAGARTTIWVALRKDDLLLGAFVAYRREVAPFTDKQIALLQNFAQQAVIAMENVRLITETREALEQQTATAEVLGVINSSPGDLPPVFDAMLKKATNLCDASFGILWNFDGNLATAGALHQVPEAYAVLCRAPFHPSPGSGPARMMQGEKGFALTDLAKYPPYLEGDVLARAIVDLAGARSVVIEPLRKDTTTFGAITLYRQEVRPFTEKQIALLQNFAQQAVIAMENARLINETREALEQQTAAAEVLGVINSSRDDLAPVFDVLLDKALQLSEAAFGALMLHEGDDRHRVVAVRGVSPARVEFWTKESLYLGPGAASFRYVRGERRPFQVPDAADRDLYQQGHPAWRTLVDDDGVRTWLAVPLHKDSIFLGSLITFRREVRLFSDKQIALLQNFAQQAVIAMENARLLEEIRQRQAELRVTFDNMGDGVVMFDAEHRLGAWNRNFQELLDLPDAVMAERPSYTDYLRVLAERGEFGTDGVEAELARRLRDTDQELRLERERPDGRVIEVRRNAVPDGGFVLIYSDITERKRSEAEIRAARDAAEAAYHDLQAAQANLVQAQKMAALGQLTAGIAHEIKNPLNFVNNFASLSAELLDELKEEVAPALAALDGDKREGIDETIEMLTGNLDRIVEHGQRADNIVKSMLEHSRGVSGERREVDLNALIEDAINLAYHGARAQDASFDVTLERDYAPALAPIEVAPQEMTRVLLNLIGNGFYAANKRAKANSAARYRPTLSIATLQVENAVEITVRDNGTGIAPEIRDKLFQPFFTTKPTGEGTGLGLSISYDIVTQQHGGTITVESEPGSFAKFTVRLPRH